MSYIRMFDDNEAITLEGANFARKVHQALILTIEEWAKKGFDTHDIEEIAIGEVALVTGFLRLKRQHNKYKAEKGSHGKGI